MVTIVNPATSELALRTAQRKVIELLAKYHQGVKVNILTALYQYHHDETLEYKPKKLTEFLEDMDGVVIRRGRAHLAATAGGSSCLTPHSAASLETVQAHLVEMLVSKKHGIHLRNLGSVYKRAHHHELEYERFGFPSLADLVESIPRVHIARKSNQKKYALVTLQGEEAEEPVPMEQEKIVANPSVENKEPVTVAPVEVEQQTPPSLAAATFSFEDDSDAEEEPVVEEETEIVSVSKKTTTTMATTPADKNKDMSVAATPASMYSSKSVAATPASVYHKDKASPSPQHACFHMFAWLSGKPNHQNLLMSP